MKVRPAIALSALCSLALLTSCGGGGGGSNPGDNIPPVAVVGHDVSSTLGSAVILEGSGSFDNDNASNAFKPNGYAWTFIQKPTTSSATILDADNDTASFIGDVPGEYTIELVVNDALTISAPAIMTVTVLSQGSFLPDTGQTKCYNSGATEIACPPAGQPFHGQDAQISSNPPRLLPISATPALPADVVLDQQTGLFWQATGSAALFNWYEAAGVFEATYNPSTSNVCGNLTLGGFNDWRLPARLELLSLVNYGSSLPAAFLDVFPDTAMTEYWTSQSPSVGAVSAWAVNFEEGRSTFGFGQKDVGRRVRCVRGNSWGAPQFIANANGTVSNTATAQMWQQADDGVARNWQDALNYCNSLALAGFTDWRMPDIKELASIVNSEAAVPSIDTSVFPTTQSLGYWSSTSGDFASAMAWHVDFAIGWVDKHDKQANFNLTRCVR